MYKIKVNGISADKIVDSVKKELEYCMNDLVLDMKNDATDKAYENEPQHSQRTGQLGDTMIAKTEWQGSVLVGKVETTVEYAEYVEHGTGIYADEHRGGQHTRYRGKIPHLVGKKYVDKKGKERIHSGWVWINGQEPKHFMLRTYEEYKPKVKSYFKIKR